MDQTVNITHPQCQIRGDKRRVKIQLSGLLFFLIVIASIGWCLLYVSDWMKSAENMPLAKIVISGERHYTSDDDIRSVILSQESQKTFVTQDVTALQGLLREELSWLKSVTVRKQWPDELIIQVAEYSPFAQWNDDYFIDQQGEIFSLPQEKVKETMRYPLLYGPDNMVKRVLESYSQMNQLLAPLNLRLALISFNSRYSWTIILDNGIKLELGQDDRVLRLKRFIQLYPLLVEQTATDQRIDYVDMRYKSGVAVGYVPQTEKMAE